MNEDSVALIIREKCVYRIRIILKKKRDLELSANVFLKDTYCFLQNTSWHRPKGLVDRCRQLKIIYNTSAKSFAPDFSLLLAST